MHQGIGTAQVACHRKHHGERMFRYRHGVCAGSIHDRDALAGGGIKIDVVDPNPGAPNHP